ncbi:uncharacterized protein N0V89_003306 [Didymosphaeria variabile]|uniref:F-box domain-containing protein n=1 Tax=Didymosphaeria variabile TaxID=1932322 RepID=A0A9W8XT96_9PLEO|nr:uncharacterized protein N0V89_003306 [Didymosphaeria variabile]KAJ4358722.1 hypothetical protein N0V89_003306 [Didymosphaeria variabile]
MAQPQQHLLTLPDELTLMIFNELRLDDRRAVLQVNKQLLWTFSPVFFECIGLVDVNFLEGSHANLDGYKLASYRIKNLAIHNNAAHIYPRVLMRTGSRVHNSSRYEVSSSMLSNFLFFIDIEFLPSIEALCFFNNTKAQTTDDRGQEDLMKRFAHIKSKHSPGSTPVLKVFKHRQTIRWPTGSQTVPGHVLAAFVQQFSGMLVQVIQQNLRYMGPLSDFAIPTLEYACHQHGEDERNYRDIKAFFRVANGLVGWGMNFPSILYTGLMTGVGDDFKQEAEALADALSPAISLKVLLLITPATSAAFNKVAKKHQRGAVKYLVDKLADRFVFLETVFVANRNILNTPSRRRQIRQAVCYRIRFDFDNKQDMFSVVSPLIKELSPKETEALKNLGGDTLLIFNDYERAGLGALYLGEDETKVCQQKRDERLEQEQERDLEQQGKETGFPEQALDADQDGDSDMELNWP